MYKNVQIDYIKALLILSFTIVFPNLKRSLFMIKAIKL